MQSQVSEGIELTGLVLPSDLSPERLNKLKLTIDQVKEWKLSEEQMQHLEIAMSPDRFFDAVEADGMIEITSNRYKIPYALFFLWSGDLLRVDQIFCIPNAEIRTSMIRRWKNKGFEDFIKDGGGSLYMSPINDKDYQFAAIYKLEIPEENGTIRVGFALKLINRTMEPGADAMTPEERVKIGLTPDGFKIYVQGLLKMDAETEGGEKTEVPCGQYFAYDNEKVKALLAKLPKVQNDDGDEDDDEDEDEDRVTRSLAVVGNIDQVDLVPSNLLIMKKAGLLPADHPIHSQKIVEVNIPFANLLDAIGWTWGLNPGEYNPVVEA